MDQAWQWHGGILTINHYFYFITNIFQLFHIFKIITNNPTYDIHNFVSLFTSEALLLNQANFLQVGNPLLSIFKKPIRRNL